MADVWEKQPNETTRSFSIFQIYRDMGPSRTHAKVVQQLGRKPGYKGQLQEWSARYNWVARCEAYDKHMDELRIKAAEEELKAMVKRQTRAAMFMQEKAQKMLRDREFVGAPLAAVTSLMVEGAKLERLNRGEPTDSTTTKNKVDVSGEVKTTNVNRKEKVTKLVTDKETQEILKILFRKTKQSE